MTDRMTPEKQEGGAMRLKVVEVHGSDGGDDFTDFLIADEVTSSADVLQGKDGVYCQVADRLTADIFVKAVNCFPDLRDALASIKWRSDDKDNMEFAARITYVQMDAIRAALAKARGEQP